MSPDFEIERGCLLYIFFSIGAGAEKALSQTIDTFKIPGFCPSLGVYKIYFKSNLIPYFVFLTPLALRPGGAAGGEVISNNKKKKQKKKQEASEKKKKKKGIGMWNPESQYRSRNRILATALDALRRSSKEIH